MLHRQPFFFNLAAVRSNGALTGQFANINAGASAHRRPDLIDAAIGG